MKKFLFLMVALMLSCFANATQVTVKNGDSTFTTEAIVVNQTPAVKTVSVPQNSIVKVDSTAVTNITNNGAELIYQGVKSLFSDTVWKIIFFVGFLASEALALSNKPKSNSVLQVLWYMLKALANFLSSKRTPE